MIVPVDEHEEGLNSTLHLSQQSPPLRHPKPIPQEKPKLEPEINSQHFERSLKMSSS